MGCRIFVGREKGMESSPHAQACLFDSVTDTVFGPLTHCVEALQLYNTLRPDGDPRMLEWSTDGPGSGFDKWHDFHEAHCEECRG